MTLTRSIAHPAGRSRFPFHRSVILVSSTVKPRAGRTVVRSRDRETTLSPITLADFLSRPDTDPASEFIDGQIDQKPMPQGEHSALQGELTALINTLRRDKIARAFPELRCTFGDRPIVQDVAVFTWERIARRDRDRIANSFDRAPGWTIEILSPDQSALRPTKNILHCLQHGCAMGWLVEPSDMSVLVYVPDRGTRCIETPDSILPSQPLPAI